MPTRPGISAYIICKNEAANIGRCLASLDWCDEVVVVDSGSTDSTLEVCGQHKCRTAHRDWTGYVDQKNHALSLCTQPWTLSLDADEEVSPELRAEILGVLEADGRSGLPEDGFELLRVVFYLGRWWRKGGWYPEHRLRLARRGKVAWQGALVHESARVDGPVGRLRGELRHYTYSGIADQVDRINAYSTAAALSLHGAGRRATLADILLKPKARFLKFYFLRSGWREGFAGLTAATAEAFYVFLKYSKLRDLERTAPRGGGR
jgi:glycosyltransferase involved in cell wall biosynthesis